MRPCVVVLALAAAACSRTSASDPRDPPSPPRAPPVAVPSAPGGTTAAASPSPPPSAAPDDLRWETTHNIELVPYCLPVPVSYLAEDTSERWEHGRKVFVRRAPPPGAKRESLSRMDLSPTCGPRKLDEMFHDDEKAIAKDYPGATFTLRALKRDGYALSWRAGDRIHYGKMWVAKGDPGCFVKAVFDYDATEQPVFAQIIGKVATASPECKD